MTRKSFLRSILTSFLLVLGSCSDILGFQTLPPYRYRVVVEVDTPEGLRRGSNVIQVETHRGPGWSPAPYETAWHVAGDAVTVDLDRRGKLFMALRHGIGDTTWTSEAMLALIGGSASAHVPSEDERLAEVREILALRGWHCIKGCAGEDKFKAHSNGGLPLFLTFANRADPASVRVLDPDRLDQAFGRGVSLRDIRLAITDDPVSRTAVASLPWLPDEKTVGRLPAQPSGAPGIMFTRLNKTDFTRDD